MMECACKYYVVNKGGLKRVFLLKIEKYANYYCKKIKKSFFFHEINFHQKLLQNSALWSDKALPVLPQVFYRSILENDFTKKHIIRYYVYYKSQPPHF